MTTKMMASVLIAVMAAVGCGNKTDDAAATSSSSTAPTGTGSVVGSGGAPGVGKTKAMSGFRSTAAGQNAESRLGSAGK